jgi:hypothetical protein
VADSLGHRSIPGKTGVAMSKSTGSKIWFIGFIVGALAMMAFHQAFLHVLHHHAHKLPMLTDAVGRFPMAFDLRPAPPFGLPLLAMQGLWGGVWGIIIAGLVRVTRAENFDLPLGLVFGALAITAVETTGLPGLIGLPILNSANEPALIRAAVLNGAFGFGVVFLLRPFAVRG